MFFKKIIILIYNKIYWFWLKPTHWNINYGANNENKTIISLFNRFCITKSNSILDIGCGYGRLLKLLINNGYNPVGIDVNKEIIRRNKEQNLKCIHTSELMKDTMFDVMIMSHIIEHVEPEKLLLFMDNYIDQLNDNGYLIIITPYLTKQFYMDFDHIRPYHPYSIQMIFQEKNQIQYYSKHQLEKVYIKNIRVPYNHRTISYATQDINSIVAKGFIDLICIIIYYLSFGIIGITNSWVGVFKKTK